ncbi:OmpA family protein [Xenophilus arseniciresistens]|uniref:OmpA family protein n=1 Tax=Xenophilus arseniciresistens TaxID=1283306 RepID=A0AAE3NDK3_9BURK|nr:OmpA family protein [Xenophilus arseniciresistens]MDA7419094.1 OmpA family protein [Xenophilus arseniciresistens]
MSLLLLTAGASSWALEVRRVPHSLQSQPTTFQRVAAPASSLASAATPSTFGTSGPSSSFAPAQGPSTVFRAAEVAPERLQVTQQLLGELSARQTTDRAIAIELPADVLFDFDQARLRPDAKAPLAKAAELLRSYPEAPLRIRGHTDAKGSDAYNDALSERRAQAVAGALALDGSRRVQIEGLGEREPVAPNARPDGSDDPEGRQRNRRVELLIEPS